jgi:hypothetical protein
MIDTMRLLRLSVSTALMYSAMACTTFYNAAQATTLPPATQILGTAAVFTSDTGERLEIIPDHRAGIIIMRLPDGTTSILPLEIAGVPGRYRDDRTTVMLQDDRVVVWINGVVAFSGKEAK